MDAYQMASTRRAAALDYETLLWKNGGRFDVWMTHIQTISNFIEKHGLHPIAREELNWDEPVPIMDTPNVRAAMSKGQAEERGQAYIKPRPFPGGIHVAHMHCKGEVYLLTDKQWNNFSHTMVGELQEKLASAKTVGFQQMMQLTEMVGPLT